MKICGCFLHSEPLIEEGDVEGDYSGKLMCLMLVQQLLDGVSDWNKREL